MAIISQTVLTTSVSPETFPAFTGLAFLPANTSLANPAEPQFIGWDASDDAFGRDLLNLTMPVLLFRLRTRVQARFIAAAFMGYRFQYSVRGALRPNTTFGSLILNQDSAEGGMGFGLGWNLQFNFGIDSGQINFTWRSGFRTTWEEIFSFSTLVAIDLIRIAIKLLQAAGFSIAMTALDAISSVASVGSFYGLLDSASNQFARLGYLEIKPKVALHGNLLDAVAAVSAEFKIFMTALKKAGIKPSAGPVMNIYFPVRMTVVRISTNFGNYDVINAIPGGQFNLSVELRKVDGPPVPDGNPVVQNLSAIHTHTIDLLITFAIKLKIKLWSVFSQEVSIPINLPSFVPELRAPLLGPYFNRLRPAGAADADAAAVELPEVIWG